MVQCIPIERIGVCIESWGAGKPGRLVPSVFLDSHLFLHRAHVEIDMCLITHDGMDGILLYLALSLASLSLEPFSYAI
jgi:hypothetical protein